MLRFALSLTSSLRVLRRMQSSASAAASPSSSGELVLVTRDANDAAVVLITLNRPDKMNALTEDMGDEFRRKVTELSKDDSVRAVVLTGSGKAFSAGGDLDFLDERCRSSPSSNIQVMKQFYDRFLSIRHLPVPVIAAINGPAIGAGMCLASACDLRVTFKKAKLGYTFVGLGLHPGMAATHFLPRITSPQTAAYMLLTGCVIGGDEALHRGLVLECVNDAEHVLTRSLEIARAISGTAPLAVRHCLRNLRNNTTGDLERSLWQEATAQGVSYASQDIREGIRAVREKRQPVFNGV